MARSSEESNNEWYDVLRNEADEAVANGDEWDRASWFDTHVCTVLDVLDAVLDLVDNYHLIDSELLAERINEARENA